MSLRPGYAKWFELLTTREDLTTALAALADTGKVELEARSEAHQHFRLDGLQEGLQEWNRLARRYLRFLPTAELSDEPAHGQPRDLLQRSLDILHDWETAAEPLVRQHENLTVQQGDLRLLTEMLQHPGMESIDFSLLPHRGDELRAALFVLPPTTPVSQLPAAVMSCQSHSPEHDFLLTVGPHDELDALTTDLMALKGRPVIIPAGLSAHLETTRQQITELLATASHSLSDLNQQITRLNSQYDVAGAIGQIRRLEWLVTHIDSLPASENFAWVTGWTSETDAALLNNVLKAAGVDGLVHFPPAPLELKPPVLMQNPGWAQPFEIFARMLGTPSHDEADPSRILAVLAPLLFGYMFGDVGQGLILVLTGLALQKRWPVLRLLVINGISAMLFGVIFGSVFGREDLLPALWLHPIEHPLPVLGLPLLGGVVILLLGLSLNALSARWRGDWKRWLETDAAAILLYISIVTSFLIDGLWPLTLVAFVWYFTGHYLQANDKKMMALAYAAGELLEGTLQLLINTLSFVRVGAFALAHAGLSLAVVSLASSVSSPLVTAIIMVLGNVVILALEGLVVSIQTTRLILFEFFIRFLQGSGRLFKPLPAPPSVNSTRREP